MKDDNSHVELGDKDRLEDMTDEWIKAYLKKQRQKETAALITNTTTGGSASAAPSYATTCGLNDIQYFQHGVLSARLFQAARSRNTCARAREAETAAAKPDNAVQGASCTPSTTPSCSPSRTSHSDQ